MKCRACGASDGTTSLTLTTNDFGYERCRTCKTMLATPRPSPEQLKNAYANLITGEVPDWRAMHTEEGLDPYRRLLLAYAGRRMPGRRLVEIGGGLGTFSKEAARRGWICTDYEPTAEAASAASAHASVTTFGYDELPPIPPASADLAVMWEVIEHVWDIHAYLTIVREALVDDGIFLLSTPNFDRRGYLQSLIQPEPPAATSPPVHIAFFTSESLKTVVERAGFRAALIHERRLYSTGRTRAGVTRAMRIATGGWPSPTLYAVLRKD